MPEMEDLIDLTALVCIYTSPFRVFLFKNQVYIYSWSWAYGREHLSWREVGFGKWLVAFLCGNVQ